MSRGWIQRRSLRITLVVPHSIHLIEPSACNSLRYVPARHVISVHHNGRGEIVLLPGISCCERVVQCSRKIGDVRITSPAFKIEVRPVVSIPNHVITHSLRPRCDSTTCTFHRAELSRLVETEIEKELHPILSGEGVKLLTIGIFVS